METSEIHPSPEFDLSPKVDIRHQQNCGSLENRAMLKADKKTTINGNLVGAIANTKEKLNATFQSAEGQENGNINHDAEHTQTELERELKELCIEVDELKASRQHAQKLEKENRDLTKEYESNTQQQQEQIDDLLWKLEEKEREVNELAATNERMETEHSEALRLSETREQQQQEQIDDLEQKLHEKEQEVNELTATQERMETEHSDMSRISETRAQQQQEQIEQLQTELENTQRVSAELALEKEALETRSGEYRDTINTVRKELEQLTEIVKEQEILLRGLHPLLPGVDDLVDCQRHLAELTGDDIQLTAHMRECQSCQRVVTHYLFHIKTCHTINCERCAYVRQLYCGHVFTCEREGCDITGCEETKQAIRDSQLSPEELQNNKQFRDKISVHLRRITSPSCGTAECGGIFRAFQQREFWAVAVGPVNLHRHQISNRLLQMCFRILPFTVSQAEQAIIACLSHSDLWSSPSHRKRCLVCNICLTSLRSCASCTLPSCEICTIGAIACAQHSINCTTESCKIPFCRYYKHCVRDGDTVYPSPTVLALFRESILMLNHPPITGGLL
ncbi:PREDICTED: outer dense fiber protein 2-like isoform X1 [Branchiostoma belcheri]|uniref:Outer dense fiber protein 2-like isoform X1 n=1 Tax=Branchiostoma belcheri TaxID=7741 RepID=A0A6P5A2W5_BRABE|nr:PREDICTED: outer dense fiber protein 2-like isoform X1 [Branchiostoma belcheri]